MSTRIDEPDHHSPDLAARIIEELSTAEGREAWNDGCLAIAAAAEEAIDMELRLKAQREIKSERSE